jgi:hypothetical protein
MWKHSRAASEAFAIRAARMQLTDGWPDARAVPGHDLFGIAGRELLGRLDLPEPWRQSVDASLHLIDELDLQGSRAA